MYATRLAAGIAMLAVTAFAACAPLTPQPEGALLDVDWQLVEVNGRSVGTGARGERATLRLGGDRRASGNAGCNHYGGSYVMSGEELRFSELGMTRMYCEGAMDLESAFGDALVATRAWRIVDGALELLADGRVLARLTRTGV